MSKINLIYLNFTSIPQISLLTTRATSANASASEGQSPLHLKNSRNFGGFSLARKVDSDDYNAPERGRRETKASAPGRRKDTPMAKQNML